MLKYLISSKTKRDLLILLFTNPSSRFYLREICRRINQQPNAVRRELKGLESAGLVIKKDEANLTYYNVNRSSSIFDEIKGIVLKSLLLTEIFTTQLKKFSKQIKYAFIYGSYAKGDEHNESDIDIMIIGNIDSRLLNKVFTKLEKQMNREVNYTIMPYNEFNEKKENGFISRIIKDKKIMLMGDENELRKSIDGE